MKRRRIFRQARKPALFGILLGAGALMLGAGTGEATPQPDPAEVERFLDQLEAEQGGQQAATADASGKRRLHNLVESAAKRAPSEAMISQLEDVVSEKLG